MKTSTVALVLFGMFFFGGWLGFMAGRSEGYTDGIQAQKAIEPPPGECVCGWRRTCAFGLGIVGEQKCETALGMTNRWSRCEPAPRRTMTDLGQKLDELADGLADRFVERLVQRIGERLSLPPEMEVTVRRAVASPSRRPKALPGKKASAASLVEEIAEKVLAAGRISSSKLRSELGGTKNQQTWALRQAKRQGLIRVEGSRRSTTYVAP